MLCTYQVSEYEFYVGYNKAIQLYRSIQYMLYHSMAYFDKEYIG